MTSNIKNILRYSKHVELKGFGEEGQMKIQNASVAVVGMGGLGCPASFYLAASGVGALRLIDNDTVDLSNLARQILFKQSDIGKSKVECAKIHLSDFNNNISISVEKSFVSQDNIDNLLGDCSIILDCSDNFDTRYLLNKYAMRNQKTLISGAVSGSQGQVFTFKPQYPCYHCLFPVQPNSREAPSCTEAAVLGTLVGTIGVMMATEAIKEIANYGQSLAGSFLSVDALSSEVHKISFERNSDCVACTADI